ncbi:MAG TPA: tryptophan synthase subunit alpha, partial [Candidatus Saccharimonadales bacterium]|nr:tryptophan synthase subunit alpha [Candidatus Saccharimonadales bacterium]
MNAIESSIRTAAAAGRPAVAAFLTAGFPDPGDFEDLLRSVASVADLVEIGVPFSDPLADGVTIQRASRSALRAGITLDWILDRLSAVRVAVPLILMSYLNPLLAMGLGEAARRSAEAGVAGLIVPDLPFEESTPLLRPASRAGLSLVQIVTPVTPPGRMRWIAGSSSGFLYAVTATGTTGGDVPPSETMLAYLDRVRRRTTLPVLAGFGIRRAAQLREISAHADGVIVGSALIEAIERGEDPAAFL